MRYPPNSSGYLAEDTIAAIATPRGGAISIVRMSGPLAFLILGQVTQRLSNSEAVPRRLHRCQIFSAGLQLDDALFVRFQAPKSYTGEDLVEFHLHGGQFIAQRSMETLVHLGVRQALPGEFSFRAVRNGKMSLFQAQAVADLISSSNENAVSLALEKMSGAQNKLLENLASSLRQLAVLGEVGIDFADQDIEEVSLPTLKKRMQSSVKLLEGLKTSYSRGEKVQSGVRVVFTGLPNAGKSSFFNALLGEDRSIVTDIAGTTRDVVHETLSLKGKESTLTLRLEDTAGLRRTEDVIEKIGIDRTRKAAQEADLVLYLVDPFSSKNAIEEQWSLLNQPPLGNKTIGIITKSDLTGSAESLSHLTEERLSNLKIPTWIRTSAVSGAGIADATEAILSASKTWTERQAGELILTRLDHFNAVSEALVHLLRGLSAQEIDLFASDIRQALHALAPLIGETLPDDLLGKIFSDFCIGK